jgi:hypothetical protein
VGPVAKTWWRNFLGDGAPLTITLDGRDRTGHGLRVATTTATSLSTCASISRNWPLLRR